MCTTYCALDVHHIELVFALFFDSLRPSQQFVSYIGTSLPGLNQYLASKMIVNACTV